jgi:lipoprotein signal peptidase
MCVVLEIKRRFYDFVKADNKRVSCSVLTISNLKQLQARLKTIVVIIIIIIFYYLLRSHDTTVHPVQDPGSKLVPKVH